MSAWRYGAAWLWSGLTWSWRVGTIAGLPFRIHWSFWLLPTLVAAHQVAHRGWQWLELAAIIGLYLGLGSSIVAHELGHAWWVRRWGVPMTEIQLGLWGGLLEADLWPGRLRPRQEIVMALTGPAVSLVVALTLAALTWWLAGWPAAPIDPLPLLFRMSPAGLAATLSVANLGLVVVNLVPLFPLDGGRIVRGLLSLRGNMARATRLTCGLSLLLAPVVLGVGLWLGAPTVLALAVVVVIFSWQELQLLNELLDDANWRWWLTHGS